MLLFRVLVAAALIWAFIPIGRDPANPDAPTVDPVAAIAAAGATIEDIGGFCTRQPDACEVGSKTLQAVGHSARQSAKTIQELIARTAAEDEAASRADMVRNDAPPPPAATPAPVAPVAATQPAQESSPSYATQPLQNLLHRLAQATFGAAPAPATQPASDAHRGTLGSEDLAPAWRDPTRTATKVN